ncbi:hypothetical protein [Paucibacter sp. Y2R2-4]|uniref:hypothetical protein n=1 Tax=Paucibacter sp. Y2R2-4 TaxID=2893553 RepID=UPI0021E46796|nr:hypothetical protein [Paucibacter sp. Y2R2-4]MCV2349297.1 hypothetical protein [Paucibacter sp. Y2R2-4]
MTSKHYGWQKRWRVDLAARQAVHESGLIVEYTQDPADPAAWDGELLPDPAVHAALIAKHGPHNIGPMMARLMREAGQIYKEALNDRH